VTGFQANCPQCGSAVTFRWAQAVQTTCPACKSILVRRDLNLERVGSVAEFPLTGSPIQIGTTGRYQGKTSFEVVGRIVYEYERGLWNEWHVRTTDGKSGWLSDAMDEYAISFQVDKHPSLPIASAIRRDASVPLGQQHDFLVTSVTVANYKAVEGELPFTYWAKTKVPFADLLSTDGRFATIDYSEDTPLLFIGTYESFGDLHLSHLREFAGW
jgi:hypothetical protein